MRQENVGSSMKEVPANVVFAIRECTKIFWVCKRNKKKTKKKIPEETETGEVNGRERENV
jgi:hypothetical protein